MSDDLQRLILAQGQDRIQQAKNTAAMAIAAVPRGTTPAWLEQEIEVRHSALMSAAASGLDVVTPSLSIKYAVRCERALEQLMAAIAATQSREATARFLSELQREKSAEQARQAEKERHASESARIRQRRDDVRSFFSDREGMREGSLPDDDQADVVAADESHLLVTARAGSGKTRALTLRAAYLIEAKNVSPEEIIILAFNRKAAAEIKDRLEEMGCSPPHVMTFHALARSMADAKGEIITDDEDEQGFSTLREQVASLISNLEVSTPLFAGQLQNLMLALDRLPKGNEDGRVQTIEGAWVDGIEIKLVWDFFFEHGYQPTLCRSLRAAPGLGRPVLTIKAGEKQIAVSLADGSQYRVDDSAPDRLVFVELERPDLGATREMHHQRWRQYLQSTGLSISPISTDQLWKRVKALHTRQFVREATSYVMRMRNQGLDPDLRAKMVEEHKPSSSLEHQFLGLAEHVYAEYAARISKGAFLDFQELLYRASIQLKQGRSAWRRGERSGDVRTLRHLMIDEFQDVSPLFMRMVEAMRVVNPQLRVMGVGDDWQAINGFAGATTSYFDDYSSHFSGANQLALRTNYRSDSRIVAAGNLVMSGRGSAAIAARGQPGQLLVANLGRFTPVQDETSLPKLVAATRRIIHQELEYGRTVALLSRTRLPVSKLTDFTHELHPLASIKVSASTVHQYKGKEADAIILLDASERSFPLIGKNWFLFRVFGDTDRSLIEDERRLLYVALTRATSSVYLVVDGSHGDAEATPLLGDADALASQLNWELYPPPGADGRSVCTIEVTNLSSGWQDNGGTVPIKDALKRAGYTYSKEPIARWSRAEIISDDDIDEVILGVQFEPWIPNADRVLVTFFENGREHSQCAIKEGRWVSL